MNISTWLTQSTKRLHESKIKSAKLDAEIILAETLRKSRVYLHAHPEEMIDPRRVDIADARLELRLERVPIAYIVGHKEFYGRKFTVSPAVLIPRPESEAMISLLLEMSDPNEKNKTLIDVGTGSGCLGITASLERPNLRVILSDVSQQALFIAEKNADALEANVSIIKQSLLDGHIEPLDYILANLPYVDKSWQTSPELRHEPSLALYASQDGLDLIYKLLEQAKNHLTKDGLIFIEADPIQYSKIIQRAEELGYTQKAIRDFIIVLGIV